MFLLFSSAAAGQNSAQSGDKAFEDWLSDDVNSYQRLEPYALHLLSNISDVPVVFFQSSFVKYLFLHVFLSGGGYSGNQENRYVGFGNTVTPEKKEDDFLNNAMTSIYSVGHNISSH